MFWLLPAKAQKLRDTEDAHHKQLAKVQEETLFQFRCLQVFMWDARWGRRLPLRLWSLFVVSGMLASQPSQACRIKPTVRSHEAEHHPRRTLGTAMPAQWTTATSHA